MKKRVIDQTKGQVTIFIIFAIIIVVMGVLIFMFWPQIQSTLGLAESNPSAFIQVCLEEEIQTAVATLSLRGGSLEPQHYYVYDDTNIEYLCYTNEYYKTCTMQQPMLIKHIESEIENNISDTARQCFEDMKESFEKQGFDVRLRPGNLNVELLPEKIVVNFNHSLILTKEDSTKYETFSVVLDNNLYELTSIAKSILGFETTYGDSETTTYMDYYPDLKIEKKKQTDGTTIYIITERSSENKFQFASRSLAWPPGYGI